MSALLSDKQVELLAELEGLPDENFPLLLQMIRTYRESLLLKPASDSFRQGWEEAKDGKTTPVDRLWEGIPIQVTFTRPNPSLTNRSGTLKRIIA